ncbi:MAG: cysteine hydrolase family protein [Planctomycetota bacterium]
MDREPARYLERINSMEADKIPINYFDETEMIRPIITLRKKRVLIDVDTQRDLFVADGKACIRNHRRVLANIRRVMAWARRDRIRVISTAQVHLPDDHEADFCIAGTEGICKIPYTIRDKHVTFESGDSTDLPRELLKDFDQIVLCKRTDDPFDEPRAERVLTELKVSELIVIGGPIETAVLHTVLGLLLRNQPVTVITDALGSHEKGAAEIALRKMQAKGARLVDTRSLLGSSRLRQVHACNCERCRGLLQKATMSA